MVSTPTAAEMAAAAARIDAYDIAICAAAVADYRPAEAIAGKRVKDADGWSLELVPTVDIAREFTNLIVFQRAYQASSKIITTVDQISQDTINLKQ